HQAVDRMPECRGPVLLEREMSDPRAAVSTHRRSDQPPRIARRNRDDDRRDHQPRAEKMQPPATAIAVLAEVERIELAKARVHGRIIPPNKKPRIAAGFFVLRWQRWLRRAAPGRPAGPSGPGRH